ncbi:MAG TPA: NUDIX domain-containing protein [Anaerolineae bacterium]|nr:NUDIX domain-containing protein [Anaerolineae bacterium]HNU04190.1 NUDIX domain-containing protein [Anaerolineae bacterium]
MDKPLRSYRAAGGVVLDAAGRVLLIERIIDGVHEMRLPKGHIDPGETPEAAAVREVCEETGYCDLDILADLGWSVVSFETSQERVTRDERYYLMALRSEQWQAPSFQSAKEMLFRNRWVSDLDEAEELLTFEGEQATIRRARAAAGSVGDRPERGAAVPDETSRHGPHGAG